MTTTEITKPPEWHEQRRTVIGGSDWGELFGEYGSPFTLARKKLGLVEPFEGNEATEEGEDLEPVLANWYERENSEVNAKCREYTPLLRLRGNDRIGVHIDRYVSRDDRAPGGNEIKTASRETAAWGPPGSRRIPKAHLMQIEACMRVTERGWWDNTVRFNIPMKGMPRRRIYGPFEPNDKLWEIMLERSAWFWDYIDRGEMPPINVGEEKLLYDHVEKTIVKATESTLRVFDIWARAERQKKAAEQAIEQCKALVLREMENAECLVDDSGEVRAKRVEIAESLTVDSKRLRAEASEVFEKYSKPRKGYVRLIPNFPEDDSDD